jgi:hypothetical protein
MWSRVLSGSLPLLEDPKRRIARLHAEFPVVAVVINHITSVSRKLTI